MKTITLTVPSPKTSSSPKTVNPFIQLVKELVKNNGCRFINLHYTTKGSGEEANYTLCLGVNLERAYRRDEKVGRLFKPSNPIEQQAKDEVLSSLRESLTKGIGNNSAYTNKDTYEHICPGLKVHEETGALHVYGFLLRKTTIAEGVHKKVNSSELTIAKNKVKRNFKISKFRQFVLTNVSTASINGKTLVLG
jgi:hypothetical protein